MKKEINVGLIGLGTVGAGVLKLLKSNGDIIRAKALTGITVKKICDKNPARFSEAEKLGYGKSLFTTKAGDIINDPSIDIVIELMGGYEPARSFVLSSIRKGKHVVTANKAMLARHWCEIFAEAEKNKALVYIEGSVCSGIPIIQSLNEGLAANRIKSVLGILNGTTNYILTKMMQDRIEFGRALRMARENGFAEADPGDDIKGHDAANKLSVLASVIFGTCIREKNIYREGIENVLGEDIGYAYDRFGYVLKLLAIMKNYSGALDIRVHPALIKKEHPLAAVNDEYNAVFVTGDAAGRTMFFGKGAGQMPTASAVVSDLIYLSKNIHSGIAGKAPCFICDSRKKVKLMDIKDVQLRYYMKINSVDKPGMLSKISGILGRNGVSIDSVYQLGRGKPGGAVPIVLMTHFAREGNVRKAIAAMLKLPLVRKKITCIRVEDGN